MALLNNLIVNGTTRLLGKLYCGDIAVSGSAEYVDLSVTGTATLNDGTVSGTLTLTNTTEASGTANNSPALIVGGTATQAHIEVDSNSIKAKASGTTTAPLDINKEGGKVYLSNGEKIHADNGTFTAQKFVGTSASISSIQATNLNVADVLRASRYDLQTISQLGGSWLICPTVKFPTDSNTTIYAETKNSKLRLTINDSSLNTDNLAGIVWTNSSLVKVSGTLGGITTGTMTGSIVSINKSSHTLVVDVSGENSGSVVRNHTYTSSEISDFSVMLYSRYASSKQYPVGIYLNCYDTANSSSTMRIYGGTNTNPHVMLGNLTNASLPKVNNEDPTGFGLYSDNCFLQGILIATAGSVGGFELSNNAIKTAGVQVTENSKGSVALTSTSFTRTVASTERNDWRMAFSGNFGVTDDGVLYASGAVISGDLTATTGSIGGFKIDTDSIHTKNTSSGSTANNALWLSSSNFSRAIGGTSRAGLKFAIGKNFGVTVDGTLYANGVDLTGKVSATTGAIGGFTLDTGTFSYQTTDASGNRYKNTIETKYLATGTTTLLTEELFYANDGDPFLGDGKVYIGTNGISLGNGFVATPDGVIRIYGPGYNGNTDEITDYGIHMFSKVTDETTGTVTDRTAQFASRSVYFYETFTTNGQISSQTIFVSPNRLNMNYVDHANQQFTDVTLSSGAVGEFSISNSLEGYTGVKSIFLGQDSTLNNRMVIKATSQYGASAALAPYAKESHVVVTSPSNRRGSLHVSSSGYVGLWDTNKKGWIIYDDDTYALHIPGVTWNSQSIVFSGYYTGVISSSNTQIILTVPTSKVIIGNIGDVSVKNVTIRQNGKYLGGSSAYSYATGITVSTISYTASGLHVVLERSAGYAGTNNDVVGVAMTLTVTIY